MRRFFRAVFLAGVVAAAVAVVRSRKRDVDPLPQLATAPRGEPWPPLRNESPAPDELDDPAPPPAPAPVSTPTPSATAAAAPEDEQEATLAPEPGGVPVGDAARRSRPLQAPTTWTDPAPDGGCPDGFPIKAKMTSKIFHAPGQLNYDRTTPDRCYTDAAAAEADGLRAAKR